MSQKENEVIAKLVKITENQLKIIKRLAQAADPMLAYLNRAAAVAVANAGVLGEIRVNSNGDGNYTVQISGTPEDNLKRQALIDNFYKVVESQRPDLNGKVNLIF